MVQAHVEGERLDEIKEYVDTRVISANEAAAGIFGFDVHFFGKAGVLGSQARVVSSLGVGVLII